MAAQRLQSMDVTIRGCSRTFEWDPAEDFGEGDESSISLAALEEAETTEVNLVEATASMANVEVTVRVVLEVNLDLEIELDGESISDADGVRDFIENGGYDIDSDVDYAVNSGNFLTEDTSVEGVHVTGLYDENGDDFEA